MTKQTSDGGSTSYYELPLGATELNDLIEHKNMSFAVGNIFKAAYRLGQKEGAEEEYDLRKIIYFANRRLMQLGKEPSDREKISQIEVDFGEELVEALYRRVDKIVDEKFSKLQFRAASGGVVSSPLDAVFPTYDEEYVIPSHRANFLREYSTLGKGGSDAF